MRATCTCGFGAAISGVTIFLLGSIGWLTPAGIAVALAIVFGAACALRRISPLHADFWRARFRALAACASIPLGVVYVAMLVVATRAVIPEGTGYSDAIYYHLAYAQDWANAGRLVVDPYMAFIFYANNFVLFFAAWITVHAGAFVQFLTWSFGLLGALALYAAVEDCAGSDRTRGWAVAIGLLSVVALIFTPIFLDYSVLGYIDVPIGAMALLAVVALQVGIRESRTDWLFVSAVLAGFLVGMKASFLVLLPVFAIALAWAAAAIGARRTAVAGVLAVLCAVAAPWYVRNLVLAGDPIAPTLNIALYGRDGLWKTIEWNGLWNDMATSKSPRAFVTLPVRAYVRPTSPDFREYGASALVLFLYVPAIVALAAFALRRRLPAEIVIPIFVLTVWCSTGSSRPRSCDTAALHPLLALCVGMLLVELARRVPRAAPLAVVVAAVAALPPFSSLSPDGDFIQNDILSDAHAFAHYSGEQGFSTPTTMDMPTSRSPPPGCAATDTRATSSLFPTTPSTIIFAATA